jgi:myo-inositol 2-dehydrogenase / D-chiro-inositol 1-dehydrogenase
MSSTSTPLTRRRLLATSGLIAGAAITRPLYGAEAPSSDVNVGCIGLGSRGSVHLQVLLTTPGVRVTALCDLKPDKLAAAQDLVEKAGQPRPFGTADWKEMLSHPGLQAVTSALPVDLHAPCYQDVLQAGKDLYAEKPMCLTLAECDAFIKAAADAKDRIVQIGFQRRADPRFIEAMKLIHEGGLGKLIEGRILWSNSWGPLYDWFGKKERSGDWVMEQAVHNWDVMNWANQCQPKRAMGMGNDTLFRDKQPDRNVHDYYSGVMEYENGAIVNIIHSWIAPGGLNKESSQLIGTEGGIDFNSGTVSYRPETGKEVRTLGTKGGPDSTALAFAAFVHSVRTRTPSISPPAMGRAAVVSCLLMREAVSRGTVVTPKDIGA